MEKIGMAHDLQGVRHYQTKEMIVPLKRGKHMLEKYGAYQFQVHRADIHDILIEDLEKHSPGCIFVDHQLIDVDQRSDKVKLIFNNQAEHEFDFVIGADGPDQLFANQFWELTNQNFQATLPGEELCLPTD